MSVGVLEVAYQFDLLNLPSLPRTQELLASPGLMTELSKGDVVHCALDGQTPRLNRFWAWFDALVLNHLTMR